MRLDVAGADAGKARGTQEGMRHPLFDYPFPEVEQSYGPRDCMLYALGVGFGADPLDGAELPFVFEEPELKVLPSMAAVLAGPGFWARDPAAGLDWRRFLHVEQEVVLHRPLPASGTIHARARITRIADKGEGKGALIFLERVLRDGEGPVATVRVVNLARGNGGCGGDAGPTPQPHPLPERCPDHAFETEIDARAALIYRLSGDPNPLHADPQIARQAGFSRPILHGLCSFGIATRAVLATFCAYEPARLASIGLRFTAPVYPGERLKFHLWRDSDVVSFRAIVPQRDVVVLDHGRAELR